MIGANKFDLFWQFLDVAPPAGVLPEAHRRVRLAIAKKAILDARDAGLAFLRVGVTGYSPTDFDQTVNDLALWQQSPAQFWKAADRMFDALDDAGLQIVPVFVWNLAQFPALAKDPVASFVRDKHSASRELLSRFITEFIGRYKTRGTILFYELTNEMNLAADLDMRKRKCKVPTCVWDDFTTADMIAFARDVVTLIRSLDSGRKVSSGFSLGQTAARHLEARPEFAPTGPDWTADSAADLARHLQEISEPFDIISVHLYPKAATRFGRTQGEQHLLVDDVAAIARSAGKPLFVGEFGDIEAGHPFVASVLDRIVATHTDYAAIWAWEFYNALDFRPDGFNIEPSGSEDIIPRLAAASGRGVHARPPDAAESPRVILTWPLPCTSVGRPIELRAVASDGAKAVRSVEFLMDGHRLASTSVPPFRARFDPEGQPSRNATITARAISESGKAAEFSSSVRLNATESPCPQLH